MNARNVVLKRGGMFFKENGNVSPNIFDAHKFTYEESENLLERLGKHVSLNGIEQYFEFGTPNEWVEDV